MKSSQRRIVRALWPSLDARPDYPKPGKGKAVQPITKPAQWPRPTLPRPPIPRPRTAPEGEANNG